MAFRRGRLGITRRRLILNGWNIFFLKFEILENCPPPCFWLLQRIWFWKEHKKTYSIVQNKETLIDGVKITFFKQYTSQKISPLLLQEIKVLNRRYKIIIHLNSVFFPLNLIICLFLFLYNVSFTIAPRGELIPQALSIKPIRKKILMPFVKKVLNKA